VGELVVEGDGGGRACGEVEMRYWVCRVPRYWMRVQIYEASRLAELPPHPYIYIYILYVFRDVLRMSTRRQRPNGLASENNYKRLFRR